MSQRYYGFKPSPVDPNEPRFDHLATPMTLLAEVDPRRSKFMPVVFDQGELGSCTANAADALMQWTLGVHNGRKHKRFSRLDTYYLERKIEGSLGEGDTGAFGHDAFIAAAKTGLLLEVDWPYDISKFEDVPPAGPREKLALTVAAVDPTELAIKSALSKGQGVAFGFTVFQSFEDSDVMESGIIPMPRRGEQQIGGHEVCAVGYLASNPGYILVRNSWGADIYQGVPGAQHGGGYFLMPVAYLTSAYASDHRTVVLP